MSATAPKPLPYEVDGKHDIINVLKHRHQIPYHSRPFMWDATTYIEVVVREALESWQTNEQHWLGFIIIYSSEGLPAISDAQHRLTICFLMIVALAQLMKNVEPLSWISQYGCDSVLVTAVPPEDQDIMDRYGWTRYPNIESCYEFDFEALGNILNNVEGPKEPESKLYAAYSSIYTHLERELTEPSLCAQFLRFIYNDIKVTRMIITEWRFTNRAFISLNNIKVPVPPSILLKNAFVTAIGKEHSEEVYRVFRTWEISHSKNFEQFIQQMVCYYVCRLMTFDEFSKRVSDIPTIGGGGASGNPFVEFCTVVERVRVAKERINANQFKRLLDMGTRSHEVMDMCLLPLAYAAETTGEHAAVEKLLYDLVAFSIRSPTPMSFNSMTHQSFLRGTESAPSIITQVLSGKKTVTEGADVMNIQLRHWLKDEGRDNAAVAERLATDKYSHSSFKRARLLLLYLAQMNDSHEHTLNYDLIHIDHIYPKTPGKTCPVLENPEYRHRLGNLTPFIGKNSAGVKGNSALGNKSFDKKAPEYKKSNIAMTREVAERYESTGFTCPQIEERSRHLADAITSLTATQLGLSA